MGHTPRDTPLELEFDRAILQCLPQLQPGPFRRWWAVTLKCSMRRAVMRQCQEHVEVQPYIPVPNLIDYHLG